MTEGWVYDVVIEKEKRRESFFFLLFLLIERERERESKSYPLHLKQINLISFLLLLYIHRERRKKLDSPYWEELPLSITFLLFLRNSIGDIPIYFNCRCADRMLSIVIILFIIQQFYPTEQLKSIQATLASTVELPCLVVNQTIESASTAKVNTKARRKRYLKFILFFRSSGFVMIKAILSVLILL